MRTFAQRRGQIHRAGPFDLTGIEKIPGTEGCYAEDLSDGFTFGDPQASRVVSSSAALDGEAVRDGLFNNRTPVIPLRFRASTSQDLARGISEVWRWCASPDAYTWQHPDRYGVPTMFEAQRAWLEPPRVDDFAMLRTEEYLNLSIECWPFGNSPNRRTTETFTGTTGDVTNVPIVGAARTPGSLELWTTQGVDLRNVLILSHPSLASGFDPTPNTQTAQGARRIPLANLPRSSFALMGQPPSGEAGNIIIQASTWLGPWNNPGAQVNIDNVTYPAVRSPGQTLGHSRLGVVHLPTLDVASGVEGEVRISMFYYRDSGGQAENASFVMMVPLDDDASLTSLAVPIDVNNSTPYRLWLDAADIADPTRQRDAVWIGRNADRSDARTLALKSRWSLPALRPSYPAGTTSLAVYSDAGSFGRWRASYRPKWPGMAAE